MDNIVQTKNDITADYVKVKNEEGNTEKKLVRRDNQ